MKRLKLHIKGVVQGVGFRPFLFNLAKKLKLSGYVLNDPFGVTAEIEGEEADLKIFLKKLKTGAPPSARIKSIHKEIIPLSGEKGFVIKNSLSGTDNFVFIPFDLSVCDDCLAELFDPTDRRFLYPFINCTNCGPRYTIIKNVPYDRKNTTMSGFKMCVECSKEYTDPCDRRFHAQPDACFTCGPQIRLISRGDNTTRAGSGKKNIENVIKETADHLNAGKIVAVKGLGGYHIACDAKNDAAVKLLREKKNRPAKPFALMVSDTQTAEKICRVGKKEKELLLNPKRPIVLLKIKKKEKWMDTAAPSQKYLGIMLPSAPLHYLLFHYLKKIMKDPVLVMTSANLQDMPLIKDEKEIFKLKGFTDYFLVNNRPIHTRCDDSISRVYNNKEYILRKARGYVPDFFEYPVKKQILGCGAELKSAFSAGKGNYVITSQYLGDLKNQASHAFFLETLSHFKKIFNFAPEVVAYDCHPGYLSTQYALSLEKTTKIPVQHHHAHAASCMVEHGLDEKVIGVIFDGTGFGSDGNVWGGEFLICDLKEYKRAAFFDYFGLPGNDKAIEEPFRVALYILHDIFKNGLRSLKIDFVKDIPADKINLILKIIQNRQFSKCSSVGRLFDALASILRLKDKITYEAEAAILLEMIAEDCRIKPKPYPFTIEGKNVLKIKWQPLFHEIVKDVCGRKDKTHIAYRFHYTLACITRDVCVRIRKVHGLDKVVLSGGVFQNRLLLTLATRALKKSGFRVYTHSRFPCNDGCISIGQVAIANRIIRG